MRYDPAAFGDRGRDQFIAALRAEGIEPVTPGYVPLHRTPAIRRAMAERAHEAAATWPLAADGLPELPACPNAEHAADHSFWLFQYALLGEKTDMDDIVAAMRKIQRAWG
jgi:hypothetical protein